MKIRLCLKLSVLAVVALLFAEPALVNGGLWAQSDTDAKIRLMADTLRARDTGDYLTAQRLVAQLQQLASTDPNVARLKAEIDAAVARQPAPTAPVITVSAPVVTATPVAAPAKPVAPPKREGQPARVAAAAPAPVPGGPGDTRSVVESETQRINDAIARAREIQRLARAQASRGENTAAVSSYDYAIDLLPANVLTENLLAELRTERSRLSGENTPASNKPRAVDEPANDGVTPSFAFEQKVIAELLDRGRAQFLAGDVNGAEATFKEAEARDANNGDAKDFLRRIAEMRRGGGWLDREKTREQMLEEASRAWQRPQVFQERVVEGDTRPMAAPLMDKLNRITIPNVNFSGVALGSVVSTLSSISEEYDVTGTDPKGVNIVLIDPNRQNPMVNITLRNLTLRRVLDFITDSVGFQYEVQLDAVVLRPGGEVTNLETDFFPISRATVIRMTGAGRAAPSGATNSAGKDPFASTSGGSGATASVGVETDGIRSFLQQAGVNFDSTGGASLVYDGSELIVTHTSRNLSRIRNILNRYNNVRQVEIEAKFIDVDEGVLEEAGIQWTVTQQNGDDIYQTNNRTVADAFSPSLGGNNGQIVSTNPDGSITTLPIPNNPATLPRAVDLARGASALGFISSSIGRMDVDATIRALSRNSGTDLLSAPKVTVLSGNPANITVAQEFRYPQSYGDTQSEVGQSGTGSNSGSAGVTITAGTPQNFATRNVGVELMVTPTVEEDDYSISLDLNPKVTEFDGFVEYGGSSIAIAGGKTVTVPSGFFQPIFSVREVKTKVTTWDGATVVMGGLTREEVKRVKDKVPVLGDIPLLGRLFRSEGESNQKRNLLIFVTANLVSPGGSLKKQDVRGVSPNSLFQNPTIVTPGGSVDRSRR